MLAGGHNEIYGYINQIHHLPEAMMLYGYWKMLYATILIICISELYDRFTCFVSQDKVKNFVIKSDFSMGIWLVHWPLIKSFSSYILVDNSMERRELLSVNFVVTNIVVIALGLLFALLMDIIKRYLKKQVIWNAT